jgi:hypothetical protein
VVDEHLAIRSGLFDVQKVLRSEMVVDLGQGIISFSNYNEK